MLKIRRYHPEDKEAVRELHYAGVAQIMETDPLAVPPDDPAFDSDLDDIEGVYLNNKGDFLVGLEENRIVAMGAVRPLSATCGEIKRIRVRRDCQRRGFAGMMIQKLAESARELGYSELCLDTLASNVPAQRLFEKCGFRDTGRGEKGVYDLIFYGIKL